MHSPTGWREAWQGTRSLAACSAQPAGLAGRGCNGQEELQLHKRSPSWLHWTCIAITRIKVVKAHRDQRAAGHRDCWQRSHWGHELLIITTTDCCPLPVMQRPWKGSGRSTHSTCRQALHQQGQAASCSASCRQRPTSRAVQPTPTKAFATSCSAGLQSVLVAGQAKGKAKADQQSCSAHAS